MRDIKVHIKRNDMNAIVTLIDEQNDQRFITTMSRNVQEDDPRIERMKNNFRHIPYGEKK